MRGSSRMEYSIDLVDVEKEAANGPHRAYVVYRFAISNGSANAFGDVLLPDSGVDVIEQKGKDPQTAAKIALERLLKRGRDPFESQILLSVPFGHAEYFSRNGNYEALPTLTE
jgi:hypothetical protein